MSDVCDELISIADKLQEYNGFENSQIDKTPLKVLADAAETVGRAWSGSSLGYHSYVYYSDFKLPPSGAHFSTEWGLMDVMLQDTTGNWVEYSPEKVKDYIYKLAKNPDLTEISKISQKAIMVFEEQKADILSILTNEMSGIEDKYLENLKDEIEKIEIPSETDVLNNLLPSRGQVMTRDTLALGQGRRAPPHVQILKDVIMLELPFEVSGTLEKAVRKVGSHLSRKLKNKKKNDLVGTNIFIGHGRSTAWRDLKDFVNDRLRLPWDEFNRVPVAGVTNITRLSEMLDSAAIAFLVMTGEDEQLDGTLHARLNVVHEAGLFQGRLGFSKAIVLLEDGCEDFSNIHGLGQIRFPKGNIGASFEEIRRVLEREELISDQQALSK